MPPLGHDFSFLPPDSKHTLNTHLQLPERRLDFNRMKLSGPEQLSPSSSSSSRLLHQTQLSRMWLADSLSKSKELYRAWRYPFQGNEHLTCHFVCIKILIYHLYRKYPTHLSLIQNVKFHTEQYNNKDCQKFLGTVRTLLWKERKKIRTAQRCH
ncbi:hypothetical protein LEMLEM_LOCUS21708 [Lemmus lemmus]